MKRIETDLPGVIIFESRIHEDDRGFFMETYRESAFGDLGVTDRFVQDNHSRSLRNTIRGIHFQLRAPQAKLCRVTRGEVFDVVADIRTGSPTFGRWTGVHLSEDNRRLLYVPPGFAHGFLVLSDFADFLYKCGSYYDPGDEFGIRWDDPSLDVNWPLANIPVISPRDAGLPLLEDIPAENLPEYVT